MNTIRTVSSMIWIFRAFSIRFGATRPAILAVTVMLAVLPFWVAKSETNFNAWLSNRAMASTVATVKLGQQLDVMTDKQKTRHAQALYGMLSSNPEMLTTLNSDDIILSFSYPDLRRNEGSMQLWQYRSRGCVLDIFFQDAGAAKKPMVTHYEIRPRERAYLDQEGKNKADNPVPVKCVKTIAAKQRA